MSVRVELTSSSTMKPPKLPGAEKFKFADKRHEECAMTAAINCSNLSPSFIRGLPSRSTCPSPTSALSSLSSCGAASLPSQPSYRRYESKRRPVLPISGRMASRVLTITNIQTNHFDIRDMNVYKIPANVNVSVTVTSVPVSTSIMTPTTTSGSRVSVLSDSSGSQCSSSSVQTSPRSLGSPLDRSLTPSQWARNAHRLSTSSQSSWEDGPESGPESTLWITRK